MVLVVVLTYPRAIVKTGFTDSADLVVFWISLSKTWIYHQLFTASIVTAARAVVAV